MFDAILHDLRLLGKSEALIVNVWVNLVLRRGPLLFLASLIGSYGLAMLNLAGFYPLSQSGERSTRRLSSASQTSFSQGR